MQNENKKNNPLAIHNSFENYGPPHESAHLETEREPSLSGMEERPPGITNRVYGDAVHREENRK